MRRRVRWLIVVGVLIGSSLVAVGPSRAGVVSGVGISSTAIVYGGQLHTFYFDASNGNLRHGFWDGARWRAETLDGAGGTRGRIDAYVGDNAAASLYAGQLHVWYLDQTNGNLRHGWWDGTQWTFETLDGAGGTRGRADAYVGTDAAVALFGGLPHVWYADLTGGNLRHGWWDGTQWTFETLDGAGGIRGRIDGMVGYGSAVALFGGLPHVWYLDADGGNLRHGWWDGTQWTFETLDGAGGTRGRIDGYVGSSNAVALYGGVPHVWYDDVYNGNLRHAWWDGAQWTFETLDGAGGTRGRIDASVGYSSSATLYGGLPHVWYFDSTNGDLRHAWWDGAQWTFETLDGAGGTRGRIDATVGNTSSAILYGGLPHVWYFDSTNGDLRHAWWDNTQWTAETLDGAAA